MKYPGCQKAKAFKFFDQGKRPAEIYSLVKVTKHTLYNYYQLWKREREEESERKRLVEERQQRLEAERKRKERRQEEEIGRKSGPIVFGHDSKSSYKLSIKIKGKRSSNWRHKCQ